MDKEIDNENIARHVMRWDDASLNNSNIPLPDYASDRNSAICVVENIYWLGLDDEFNCHIREKYSRAKVNGSLAEFLIWCTPDEVCDTALAVTRNASRSE
jgi:hypothetical protein